jgi:hypothetical protein
MYRESRQLVTCDIKWLVTDIDFYVTAVIPVKAVCVRE